MGWWQWGRAQWLVCKGVEGGCGGTQGCVLLRLADCHTLSQQHILQFSWLHMVRTVCNASGDGVGQGATQKRKGLVLGAGQRFRNIHAFSEAALRDGLANRLHGKTCQKH